MLVTIADDPIRQMPVKGNPRALFRVTYQVAARSVPARPLVVVWLLLALLGAAVPAAFAENRIALVIGNGKYVRDPLPNPPRDAVLIADALEAVGFEVIGLVNADRSALQAALVEFSRRLAKPDTVGLFYYAGHGVQVSGQNYLLPVDVDIRTEAEVLLQGVNLNQILATLRPDSSRLAVAVLDACRNNPFSGLARGLSRGLAPVTAPAGTLIAFSTAPGEVALDGDGDNSPYSAALAAAIPTPGLTIEEVFKRTRQTVMARTNNAQVPWEHSSLTGSFVFMPELSTPQDRRDPLANPTADLRLNELNEWERVKSLNNVAAYQTFLDQFPAGAFAELAAYKIKHHAGRPNTWTWWLPQVVSTARPLEAVSHQAEELYERALRFEAEQQTEADLEHARSLFRASAGSGFVPGMYRLARLIEREARRKRKAGGSKDAMENAITAAAAWYAKAAEQAHPASERALGSLHEFGEGVRRDLAEALRLYKSAADAGDAGAMASLGYLYASGKGVQLDPAAARTWYARGANAGSERAMFNLAIMLMSEDGGAVNLSEAVKWLRAAATKGHAAAKRQLAVLYDDGRGINRDPDAAAIYLLEAYAAGDADAKTDLFNNNRRWSRSTRRAIQRQLQTDGLYPGALHGTFSATTLRALTQYRVGR